MELSMQLQLIKKCSKKDTHKFSSSLYIANLEKLELGQSHRIWIAADQF